MAALPSARASCRGRLGATACSSVRALARASRRLSCRARCLCARCYAAQCVCCHVSTTQIEIWSESASLRCSIAIATRSSRYDDDGGRRLGARCLRYCVDGQHCGCDCGSATSQRTTSTSASVCCAAACGARDEAAMRAHCDSVLDGRCCGYDCGSDCDRDCVLDAAHCGCDDAQRATRSAPSISRLLFLRFLAKRSLRGGTVMYCRVLNTRPIWCTTHHAEA